MSTEIQFGRVHLIMDRRKGKYTQLVTTLIQRDEEAEQLQMRKPHIYVNAAAARGVCTHVTIC